MVPEAQWPRSLLSGTLAPYNATELVPRNRLCRVSVYHELLVPKPSTWHSSCMATEKKSIWLEPGPVGISKFHAVVLLNEMDPPQGPTSVGLASAAPAWPRKFTVFCQAESPVGMDCPMPPSPRTPLPRFAAPTNTITVSAGTENPGTLTVWRVAGLKSSAVHWLPPAGEMGDRLSIIRENTLPACSSVCSAIGPVGLVEKKPPVSYV